MKTGEFQRDVLGEIRRELEKDGAPVERLRDLARSALELSDRHPEEVPPEDVRALIDAHPELSALREKASDDQARKDGEAIDRARKSLDDIS